LIKFVSKLGNASKSSRSDRNIYWIFQGRTWQLPPPTVCQYSPNALSDFVDASQTSSYRYFEVLLSQLSILPLRLPTLEGYVTSAGLGSESVLRASRLALADHLEGLEVLGSNMDPQSYGLKDICDGLLEVLKRNTGNDRVAMPTLEVLAFLLDSCIIQPLQDTQFKYVLIRRSASYRLLTNVRQLAVTFRLGSKGAL
jgi:hypothetical protein